jgi:hypothetical protein
MKHDADKPQPLRAPSEGGAVFEPDPKLRERQEQARKWLEEQQKWILNKKL